MFIIHIVDIGFLHRHWWYVKKMFSFLVYAYAVDYVTIPGTFWTGIIDTFWTGIIGTFWTGIIGRYTQSSRTCLIEYKTVHTVNIIG